MSANREHLPDDFAAAIKAADDYADTLNQLSTHDLPQPMDAWITTRLATTNDDLLVLLVAARTFGGPVVSTAAAHLADGPADDVQDDDLESLYRAIERGEA